MRDEVMSTLVLAGSAMPQTRVFGSDKSDPLVRGDPVVIWFDSEKL